MSDDPRDPIITPTTEEPGFVAAADTSPTISVVVAVRNAAGTIQGCLDSVLEQRTSGIELVVIDGASTDGTQAILERNAGRLAYWQSQPDRGVYQAWNRALPHVRGEWIMFLGSDDSLRDPGVLGAMSAALAHVGAAQRVVYGAAEIVDGSGAVVETSGADWNAVRTAFHHGMVFAHGAAFHHRSLFAEYGGFDERYLIAGDYEFLLRELLTRDAVFVPGVIVVRVASGGLSSQPGMDGRRAREKQRARLTHGLTRVPEWLSVTVLRALVRAWLFRTFGQEAVDRARRIYHWRGASSSGPRPS